MRLRQKARVCALKAKLGVITKLWVITLLLAALMVPLASAEVYTGVGKYGVRWFSDSPPAANTSYQVVSLDTVPVTNVDEAAEADSAATATSGKTDKAGRVERGSHKRGKRLSVLQDAISAKPDTSAKSAMRSRKKTRPSRAQIIENAQQKRCLRYETALRKIRDQRRAGYTAAQDRKMRQRRQELQEKQFTECSHVRVW